MAKDVETFIIEKLKELEVHIASPKSESKDNKPIYPNIIIEENINDIVASTFDELERIIHYGYNISIFTKDMETTAKAQAKDKFNAVDEIMNSIGFIRTSKAEETIDSKTYSIALNYEAYIDTTTNIIYQYFNL